MKRKKLSATEKSIEFAKETIKNSTLSQAEKKLKEKIEELENNPDLPFLIKN